MVIHMVEDLPDLKEIGRLTAALTPA